MSWKKNIQMSQVWYFKVILLIIIDINNIEIKY